MSKTVEEISRETGFSVTTVRFVISGQSDKYRISAKTRQIIEDYIAQHGYSLNHAARSLKLNRSDTIGFVVPDLSNSFFARLMAALEALCREQNCLLLTVATHEDPELENRAVSTLLARGVDGLVLAPCQSLLHPMLSGEKLRVTLVMLDRDYGHPHYPAVLSDNYQGAFQITHRMLTESGGPCYFLCGHAESPSIQDRIRGFSAACAEHGLGHSGALIRLQAEDSPAAGRQLMQKVFKELRGAPQAFLCSSLLVLEGALQEIKAQTGRVAQDILIGTFDDHTMLELLPNRVLSVRQDEAGLAEKVFSRLTGLKAGARLERDIVPCTLVCRNL